MKTINLILVLIFSYQLGVAQTKCQKVINPDSLFSIEYSLSSSYKKNSLVYTSINVKKTPSLQTKTEKTVSFNDNVTYEHIDNYNENDNKEENIINMNNIFSKLKKNQITSYSQSEPQLEKETTAYKIQILEDKIDKINQKIDTILNKLLGL